MTLLSLRRFASLRSAARYRLNGTGGLPFASLSCAPAQPHKAHEAEEPRRDDPIPTRILSLSVVPLLGVPHRVFGISVGFEIKFFLSGILVYNLGAWSHSH